MSSSCLTSFVIRSVARPEASDACWARATEARASRMEIASEDRSFILILLRDIDVFETTRYSSGEHIVANQLSDNPPESSVCGFAHKTAFDSLSDSRVAVRRHYSRSASLQAQSLRH